MLLIDRFKKYLEKEFRFISPSKEAMEYRQEVLSNLLDRAQEYKIKGMTDEDAIFGLCIDSLGDFKSTLLDFENKLTEIKKAVPKISAALLATVCVLLFMTIVYLVVSFVTCEWGKTWLIMVGGIFAAIITLDVNAIVKAVKAKKYLKVRALTHLIIILAFVGAFLGLQILTSFQYSWMAFLIMIMAVLFADTTIAFITNSKSKLPVLLVTIEVLSVLIYVILGVTKTVSWSPYWLIPVFAAAVDAGILAAVIAKKAKNKSEGPTAEEVAKLEEEYYTKWEL
jgi:hypothetical protein